MAVNVSPFGPKPQFELSTGLPAVGNLLFFYVAGSTSTKQDTYTSSTGLSTNTNPIVLNSLGMPPNEIWFTAGVGYKVVYAPSTDTDPPTSPIWTIDNLTGIPSSSTTTPDQWVAWAVAPTYVSATSFTVPGDQTSTFHVGRRVKTVNSGGTIYSTISVTAFGAVTTVTLVNDSGVLDAGLSAVSYGIISYVNTSDPYNTPGSGGTFTGSTFVNSIFSGTNTYSDASEIFLSATTIASLNLNGVLANGYFTVTAAANALTIAIKAVGANDPSASDPVTLILRNGTITNGTHTGYKITAALSTVISSGSTGGCANSEVVRIHVGAMLNATTGIELFWFTSSVAASTGIKGVDPTAFVTTTAEGGAGGADTAQLPYSTTARDAQPWQYLGYFEATSGATAGQWASVDKIVNFRPGMPMPGAVVMRTYTQVMTATSGTTVIPADSTIPQITEGDQYGSLAFTPKSAINRMRIRARTVASNTAVGFAMSMALFQDATAGAIAANLDSDSDSGSALNVNVEFEKVIGTASATTITMRAGANGAGTTSFNVGSILGAVSLNSHIFIEELHV